MPSSIANISNTINDVVSNLTKNFTNSRTQSWKFDREPVVFDYIHGVEDFPNSIMNNRDIQRIKKSGEDGEVATVVGKESNVATSSTTSNTAQQVNTNKTQATKSTGSAASTTSSQQKKSTPSTTPPHTQSGKTLPEIRVSEKYNPNPEYQNRMVYQDSLG